MALVTPLNDDADDDLGVLVSSRCCVAAPLAPRSNARSSRSLTLARIAAFFPPPLPRLPPPLLDVASAGASNTSLPELSWSMS